MATKRRGAVRYRRLASGEQVECRLWVGVVEADRDPSTGQRRRMKVKAKAEAVQKMRAGRDRISASGAPSEPSVTVEGFLRSWTADVLPHRVGPATVADYRSLVDRHLISALGRHRLRDLTPEQVDRFLRATADAGLSRSSVGRLRSILTVALTHAERRQLVTRNAGRLSILPATTTAAGGQRALTVAERERFIATALVVHPPVPSDGSGSRVPQRLAPLMALMLHVGLRPGEGTGLRWDDLDATARTLTMSGSIKRVPRAGGRGYDLVRGPVKKSSAGERTIRLSPTLIGLLGDHRARQADERERAGAYWVEMGLMFPSEAGHRSTRPICAASSPWSPPPASTGRSTPTPPGTPPPASSSTPAPHSTRSPTSSATTCEPLCSTTATASGPSSRSPAETRREVLPLGPT
jgi:integrase